MQPYQESARFANQNGLLQNHFKFHIEGLRDLSFFTQSMQIPSISSGVPRQPNPFVPIPHVGDILSYTPFNVNFKVDAGFLTYYSLYAWMVGYAFPHSYEDIEEFKTARINHVPAARPTMREIWKTNAVLHILNPSTDQPAMEIFFLDVFPTAVGELQFRTTDSDVQEIQTTATFHYTLFEVRIM